ncbi:MAG: hypothetical protein ABFD44_02110 [Anaerolineaceae bacterium]
MAVHKIPQEDPSVTHEKARLGLRFGLIAGLAFSLAAWLPDALQLMNAHAVLPWAKMLMGAIPVVAIFSFAGWFTARMEKVWINLLTWVITASATGWYSGHLPYEGMTLALRVFSPEVASRVAYPFHEGMATRVVIIVAVSAVVGLIAGALEGLLLDNAYNAASPFTRIISLLIWAVIFSASAFVLDSMIEQPLRGPVTAINDLINYGLKDEVQPYGKETRRALHLGALSAIQNELHQPYKLVLAEYDDIMVTTRVLIHFDDGVWATCTVMADQSTQPYLQQPSYCETVE